MTITIEDPSPGIRVLTIDRPRKRNALDVDTCRQLAVAIESVDQDPSVRAVVITGRGAMFTADNELADFRDGPGLQNAVTLLRALVNSDTPIIAAVEGIVVGVGVTMLLHCDFAFAGRSTVFSRPFVELGPTAEGGAGLLLPQVAASEKAAEMLLSGDKFGAGRAERAGLLSRVVEDGHALHAAIETAEELRELSAESVTITKRLVRRGRG
ncbi:enoyl-CoA hydratase-related protein [Nocardia pseudovaccinii]|uniref:enoyl-CoA hydratase-related protein n=1 Tax=Nocardia pseudovaccinii TaxID=189540 RepID=UPI0007A49298|nr:enoyl-CoA hydratase-related protein [Nocardia pseudovaccinii]